MSNDGFLVSFMFFPLLIYLTPFFIALFRDHFYKWPIFALNVILGFTGIGWGIAFVWAVWPKNTDLFGKNITGPIVSVEQKAEWQPSTLKNSDKLELLKYYEKQYTDGELALDEYEAKRRQILS